jgi:hypothetical protein
VGFVDPNHMVETFAACAAHPSFPPFRFARARGFECSCAWAQFRMPSTDPRPQG